MTQDHSLVGELLRSGSITKEEAATHSKKNVILRALGSEEKLKVDILTVDLEKNDKFMLCTDGLTNMVSEERMLEVITLEDEPSSICSKLVNISNEIGGIDNTTIMLIKAKEE